MTEHSQEYDAYMKSPEWESKRQQRLKLDHYRCAYCGRPQSDKCRLQVHHTSYAHLRDEVVERDLISLCPRCHMKAHGIHWKKS